ncbi:MAG: hypothetical protein KKF44_11525 [Nanoarchaeota archaeon]|nr:hypothetical protein [Nanoarchaeota archaeon]
MTLKFLKPKLLNIVITLALLAIPVFQEHVPTEAGGTVIENYAPLVLLFSYLYLMEWFAFLQMLLFSLLVYSVVSLIIWTAGYLIKINKKQRKQVKLKTLRDKAFYYTPRVLSVFYLLFISMFSFDVFGEGYAFWEMILGFFMHLLPSFVLLTITIIAWKKEKLGGILFIGLSIIFTVFFKTYMEIISFLLISFPLFFIGVLFLFNRFVKVIKKGKKK